MRLALLVLCGFASLASACSYCDPGVLKLFTLRQEARSAKIVVVGTLTNAKLEGEKGSTDLVFEEFLKTDPAFAKQRLLVLPRWLPLDPKKPKKVVTFIDVYEGKLDPFRGVEVHSPELAKYLKAVLELDDRDRAGALTQRPHRNASR